MFTTEKVSAYLNNFAGQGDKDDEELRLNFYITPITYGLASEISPKLADRIFRKSSADEWVPALEMPNAHFDIGPIAPQRVVFHPGIEDELDQFGILVENARIFAIGSRKAWPDKPDMRLEFMMAVPMDDSTMGIVRRFYKKPVFLTMSEMQPVLFDKGQVAGGEANRCMQCNEPASWEDENHDFFCQKHMRAGFGKVKLIAKQETPKEAEARALVEAEERRQRGEPAAEPKRDPLVETGELINNRSSRKKKTDA